MVLLFHSSAFALGEKVAPRSATHTAIGTASKSFIYFSFILFLTLRILMSERTFIAEAFLDPECTLACSDRDPAHPVTQRLTAQGHLTE